MAFPGIEQFVIQTLYDDFPSVPAAPAPIADSANGGVQAHLVISTVDDKPVHVLNGAGSNRSTYDSQSTSDHRQRNSKPSESTEIRRRSSTPHKMPSASHSDSELDNGSRSTPDNDRDAKIRDHIVDGYSPFRNGNEQRRSSSRYSPLESGERRSLSNESYTERSVIFSDGTSRSRSRSPIRRRRRSQSPRRRSSSPSSRSRPYRGRGRGRFRSRGRHGGQETRTPERGPRTPYNYGSAVFVNRSQYGKVKVHCLICSKECKNFLEALDHDVDGHYDVRRYPCGLADCAWISRSPTELVDHLRIGHSATPESTHLRFDCRYCSKAYRSFKEYVDHVVRDYRHFRRIHYEQIALKWLMIRCPECSEEVEGRNWFLHLRQCEKTRRLDPDIENWAEAQAKFCTHRRRDCRHFPACTTHMKKCVFAHPVCAHFPNCNAYRKAKCPLDHSADDRKCDACR